MLLTDELEFVALDLETTGLSPAWHQIVECGAVRFRADGTELNRMTQLVDPCCRIPREATRVHGIGDDMVRGQPTIAEVLPQFVQFLGGSNTILLAHNAAFDVGFLSAALRRYETAAPVNPVVDTLGLSRGRLPRLPNHRLDTVARHLRISDFTEHRSLADVLVLESVFLKLLAQPPAIRRLDDLFRVVRPLYFEQLIPAPISVPAGYEPLLAAIEVGRCIFIVYDGGTKGPQRRQVTPKTLTETRGSVYLVAHCHIDDTEKHFRLDRIVEIE